MQARRRMLPAGWYPETAEQVREAVDEWDADDGAGGYEAIGKKIGGKAVAAVAPHAGWFFSGQLAWRAWKSAIDADMAVIIGGHLPAGSALRVISEAAIESPLGILHVDAALSAAVMGAFGANKETDADNTIEVQVPLCALRFAGKPVAGIRAPNDGRAAELGRFLAQWAKREKKRIFVLGSTDLTHYGDSYGFSPSGHGKAGLAWARKNDSEIADAFIAMDSALALDLAEEQRAACSVGAAVCAMAFAREMGRTEAELLGLDSSYSKQPADSFVGYASVAYY